MASFFEPERLVEILQPDRCPLCFLIHDYGQTFLRNLLEESVTDPLTRSRLLKSRGFCRRHAWNAVGQTQALGMAVLYSHLLKDGLARIQRIPSVARFWKKQPPCPVCEAEQEYENVQVRQFAAGWAQSETLRSAFETHGLLCLPHLGKILPRVKKRSYRYLLLKAAQNAMRPLLKDLNEFLEKQDYHRSKEAMGPEWDAWIRAVRIVNGERE
jgi:hypothetical protein